MSRSLSVPSWIEAISGPLNDFVFTYVPGPVRIELMCSIKFFVKQIRNRETNYWTIRKTLFHVFVRLISRIEDYMITYLKWRTIIFSVPRNLEKSYDCRSVPEVILAVIVFKPRDTSCCL